MDDDEDVRADDHRRKMIAFIDTNVPAPSDVPKGDLSRALYTMSERHMWPDDIDSISIEQAILVWRLVEAVKKSGGFPADLRM